MLTHDHFLRAIAAEPHEPGNRLVYADWLEDQGDERAELIRVMEEMRTLPAYSDRFWELRPRRAKFKEGVTEEWLTALGYNAYRPLFEHLPEELEQRWRMMIEFIETWYGPLRLDAGNTEAEIVAGERSLGAPLPRALREWFSVVGREIGYWRGLRVWWGLNYLKRRDNRVCFCRHNSEREREWFVELEGADDPLILPTARNDAGQPIKFSEFALCCLVNEADMQRNHYPRGVLSSKTRNLDKHFARAALQDGCRKPVQLWEGDDVLLCTNSNVKGYCIRARTEHALEKLESQLSVVRWPTEWPVATTTSKRMIEGDDESE